MQYLYFVLKQKSCPVYGSVTLYMCYSSVAIISKLRVLSVPIKISI